MVDPIGSNKIYSIVKSRAITHKKTDKSQQDSGQHGKKSKGGEVNDRKGKKRKGGNIDERC